jgi:3-oxoadipate enol-lactonase
MRRRGPDNAKVIPLDGKRYIPALPPGRAVDLPGRGRAFVREAGPVGAPTLILLHGLGATADLNWFPAYAVLSRRYHLVAMDLRGHGDGVPLTGRFRLSDCADDVAVLAEVLGIKRFTAVGYSMGGVVAQLLWRDHRSVVEGLVLCSTSRNFRGDPMERALFTIYPAAAFFVRAASPEIARGLGRILGAPGARTEWREWIRSEVARSSPKAIMQTTCELANFSSHEWVHEIDVPTAVVLTTRDKLIPTRRQYKLAAAIPGATTFEVDGDHFACTEHPGVFLPALEAACRSVRERIARGEAEPGAAAA